MGNEKDLKVELPSPAAAGQQPAASKISRFVKRFVQFFTIWIVLHLLVRFIGYTLQKPPSDEDRELLRAFAPRHRPHHGKKPLHGLHAIKEYM